MENQPFGRLSFGGDQHIDIPCQTPNRQPATSPRVVATEPNRVSRPIGSFAGQFRIAVMQLGIHLTSARQSSFTSKTSNSNLSLVEFSESQYAIGISNNSTRPSRTFRISFDRICDGFSLNISE